MIIWSQLFGGEASQNKPIHFFNRIKTYIGKVTKGFDFLGFNCSPTGIRVSDAALSRRDAKVARLYEQGASKKRIGRYLAKWLIWVGAAGAANPVLGATTACVGQSEGQRASSTVPVTLSFKEGACLTHFVGSNFALEGFGTSNAPHYYFLFFSPKDRTERGGTRLCCKCQMAVHGFAHKPSVVVAPPYRTLTLGELTCT